MIEVILSRIIIDEKRQDQVIVLKEKEGNRQFPIVIGFLEASSIKMKLSKVDTPRPLTHDLLTDTITALGARLERLYIDKLIASTFHAKLILKVKNKSKVEVDCRPSDGIALAVRVGAPIFAHEEVIKLASVKEQ